MPIEQPRAILLKDYEPPQYFAKKVVLSFDLSPSQTQVKATVSYAQGSGKSRSLRLHGNNLLLIAVSIDSKNIPLENLDYGPDFLQLNHLPASFELEIITQINPLANLALEGLYLSQNKFFTQCEPEGFRRITYFLDRPDVMAVYETTLIASASQCPVLLSNGNLIQQGTLPGGKHFATWQDPFPKPSYLFALVAGELSRVTDNFVTRSGRKIDIHIYVEEENINKCAFALDSVKRAMRWDEKVYGLEYDLDLFMIVAVSDFNMGAMENKGLNIFNSKYILASPETATDDDFEKILAVVGHEYFHNWTGNRVTLRDWFQLSLKEGLTVFRDQEFSADEGSRAVKRISDVKVLREQQFAEDSGPMAHAVRPDNYIEINNFYTSTVYNKGAEVIRMLHTIIGPKLFRSAMDQFFATHDGQAVTVEDFLAIIEKTAQLSLKQFKLWYQQAGTPRVFIERIYDPKTQTLKLKFSQTLANTPNQMDKKPQVIPMRLALLSREGKAIQSKFKDQIAHEHLLLIDAQEVELTLHSVHESPIPSVGRNFSAPVIIDAKLTVRELYTLLKSETDPFNKYEAAQTLAIQIMRDHVADVNESRGLDPDYIAGFRHILMDTKNDPRLVALSMQLPSSDYLVNQEVSADLDAIFRSRIWLLRQLATACKAELLECYQRTQAKTFSLDREAIGQRDLNNACLNLITQVISPDTIELAQEHFKTSTNMTDTIGALTAQSHFDSPIRTQCLNSFYERWQQTPLVIDKWFQVQASSQHENVLAQVRTLLQHPDFDWHNPNRVYSIFRPFNKANPYGFHHRSGEGYALVADFVERIDKTNPQVAAMLCQGLSRFRKYDLKRQQQMRQQLERLKAIPQVSRDVFEVLQKSLATP